MPSLETQDNKRNFKLNCELALMALKFCCFVATAAVVVLVVLKKMKGVL